MTIFESLNTMRTELQHIKNNQKELPDGCICYQFDMIIDELESLRDKFGKD